MPQPFDPLKERLLREGFSPWRVRRYCRELADHLADLTADELDSGRGVPEAQAAARARLGSNESLAVAMLMRPCLRSWTARAPFAVLVAAPIALLVLVSVVTATLVMSSLGSEPGSLSEQLQSTIREICGFDNFKLPVLVAALVGLWAARSRLPARWAIFGGLAVACVSAALRLHVLWPGYDPAAPMHWTIEILPRSVAPMWLQRFQEAALLDLPVGLAVYWASAGARRAPREPLVVEASRRSSLQGWVERILLLAVLAVMAGFMPLLTCAGIGLVAARQRVSVIWPILGLVVVACIGAALHLHLNLAGDPTHWAIQLEVPPRPFVSSWLLRLGETGGLLNLALGMGIYWAVRIGSAPPPRLAHA